MIQIPGVEDSTVHEVIWIPWDGPGLEHLCLAGRGDGIYADGLVIGTYEVGAFRLMYEIICDISWRVSRVCLSLIGGKEELELSSDGKGHWVDEKGVPIPGLDGCFDVDISGSPFTNTLPIRRLRLQPGQSADISMVYIYVPTLQVSRTMQRYTCLESGPDGGLYRFEALESGYTAVLPVDASGLVLDYPQLFRRSWSSEYITVKER
ncbi:MAG: putative glycolipid-binding domain-containing protein [Chloroflexota bacterium]|nr:putative glycolipid-binding domain-containing protein [Chloroflexota bacterium]